MLALVLALVLGCAVVSATDLGALERVRQLVVARGGELVRYCAALARFARACLPAQQPRPEDQLRSGGQPVACLPRQSTTATFSRSPPPLAACVQSGVVVGRACPDCPRGLLASKDLQEGDLIARVPLALALRVK